MEENKEDTLRKIEELAEVERRKKELQLKVLTLQEYRVNNETERLEQDERDLQLARAAYFGGLSEEQLRETIRSNTEYITAAKTKMPFINSEFDGVVPYFRKNLILIGGKTGEGKSTTVANIISSTMKNISPVTGKRSRVLVITNEEARADVYNRITCLAKGWHYVNHDKFTNEQMDIFNKYIEVLSKDGWLTVVDDNYGGGSGVTTTMEGIETIFENLIRDKIHYDVIIIDYYQNIRFSKKNVHLNEWQVQAYVAAMLDRYKNIYAAPIIALAQVTPPDAENRVPFKQRIEGRKVILNVATCCLEMVAEREELRTQWILHKSRFNEKVGGSFYTGYDKGRFVEYSDEFKNSVALMKERAKQKDIDKTIGIPDKEKKDGNVPQETSNSTG